MDMRQILETRIRRWLEDSESSVEYAEELEGRWAVRMCQEVRNATTTWFEVGDRSLSFEAYVLPAPAEKEEVHRQVLVRNQRAWRAFFALDGEEAIVLRGRLPEAQVTLEELDLVLGEVYETIEVSFRPLVQSGFPREKSV